MNKSFITILLFYFFLSCNENPNDKCNLPYFTSESNLGLDLNNEARNSLEGIMKYSNYEYSDEISKVRTEISYELTEKAQYFVFQDTRILGPDNRTLYTWILPVPNIVPEEIHFQGKDETLGLVFGSGDDDIGRFFLRVTSIKDGEISTTCETHSYLVITFEERDMEIFKNSMTTFLENLKV